MRAKPKNLSWKDPQVQGGLEVVAKSIKEPPASRLSNLNYFMFSMGRTLMVYNLKKIGDQDWYLWGAAKLVDNQNKDGSWNAGFPNDAADTCFALLFLKRANVAHDLTEILQAPIRKAEQRKSDSNQKN